MRCKSFFSAHTAKPLLLICSFSSSVAANENVSETFPDLFLGIKGGYQFAHDDEYNHSVPKGYLLGAYGGLQFTPSWSWDVGYQYQDDLNAKATSVDLRTWLAESAIRYDWYFQENFSLYSRLGAAYWDLKKSDALFNESNASGVSPLVEIGVNYHVLPSVSVSAGYEYISGIGDSSTGEYDSHAVLLGLSYTFELNQYANNEDLETYNINLSNTVMLPRKDEVPFEQSINIQLPFNSITIDEQSLDKLSNIINALRQHPQSTIKVTGYTDSSGPSYYNQKLSEQRAKAVANKLLLLGVSFDKVEVEGLGEGMPVADNSTFEGRAKNRRVEISILNLKQGVRD